MLQLGATSLVIDGVTVFRDHADPNQFWYLPAPVRLARRASSGEPEFTLISYRGAAVDEADRGGGFLMFMVDLRLDQDQEDGIKAQLKRLAPNRPVLSPVPFDQGEVDCIALNIQGTAGTTAPPGAFVAVEEILGASVPSLYGNNQAAFSLKLSTTGATILKQAFQQGAAPIGVIYKLTFTGLRPALHVTIEADLSMCYSQLSVGLEAQVYWVKVGLEAAFEHLKQTGAIKITVADFVPDGQVAEQEKWALDFFRDKLLAEWFEPTLSPTSLPTTSATPAGTSPRPPLTQPSSAGGPPRPPGTGTGGPPRPPGTGTGGPPGTGTGGPPRPPGTGTGGPPHPPGVTGGPPAPPGGPAGGVPRPPVPPGAGSPGTGPASGGPSSPPTGGPPPAGPSSGGSLGGAVGGAIGGAVGGAVGGPAVAGAGSAVGAAAGSAAAGSVTSRVPGTPGSAGSGSGTQGGIGPGGGQPIKVDTALVTFKLKYVSKEEQKHVSLVLDRSEAVQRVYAPQGFFSELAGTLSGPTHFLDVDLDDPFFRVFSVVAQCAVDFAALGLVSINVWLSYGRDGDPGGPKTTDLVFDAGHSGTQTFSVFMNPSLDLDYSYRIEYNFAASGSWHAKDISYTFSGVTSDRTLELDPSRHLGFLEVTVEPSDIDPEALSFTEVQLAYREPDGSWEQRSTLVVRANSAPQTWRIRTPDLGRRTFTYQFVHTLVDGSVVTADPVEASTTRIAVTDPFAGRLDISVVPAWDPARVRTVLVDLAYDDAANSYHRELRLEFSGAEQAVRNIHIAIHDPAQRTFRHRATIVGTDGQVKQTDYVATTDTLVTVA